MKIVNIIGGLGNQMFQYAMYLALCEAHPDEDIRVCTRAFHNYGLHNGLELKRIFNVKIHEASLWQLTKLAYPFINYKSWQVVRHKMPRRKTMTFGNLTTEFDMSEVTRQDNVYYEGYWQNEKNFRHIRDKILLTYHFPDFIDDRNRLLSLQLRGEVSVSCHIRRGDYLKEPEMCVCTPKYYEEAVIKMNQQVNPSLYCVFSDDIGWCRQHLPSIVGDRKIVFVDWNKGNDSYRDMQLMTSCRHNIIANSSFSWWGAWLGQYNGKTVVAPKEWTANNIINSPVCDNWTKI